MVKYEGIIQNYVQYNQMCFTTHQINVTGEFSKIVI